MEYLFDRWDKLNKGIREKLVVVFLDYDGTLTPIADTPAKAILAQEIKELLRAISKTAGCKLAIISGRALSDIKNIVGLKEIIYAGNHGLEIEGPKIKFESQISPRLKTVIRNIYEEAINKLQKIKGVLIEDKGLTISIHYRLVDKRDMELFKKIFSEITDPFVVRSKIKVNSGKKVYEIRPPVEWNKGKVVLWLLARQQFMAGEQTVFAVYIGDDVTDEDAFKALKNKGLTIFVGEPKISMADYYLRDTEEVKVFLHSLLAVKKEARCQS
jgi:trehalose-phosphatase